MPSQESHPMLTSRRPLVAALVATLAVVATGALTVPAASIADVDRTTVSTRHTDDGDHVHGLRLAAKPRIAVTVPRRVQVRTRIRVAGTVPVRSGKRRAKRPVRLAERRPNGTWRVIRRKATTRIGRFRFAVPAGKGTRARWFRVVAPERPGLARLRTGVRVVRVVARPAPPKKPTPEPAPPTPPTQPIPSIPDIPDPGYEPAGDPDDWSWISLGGEPGRWNPCADITWSYNPAREATEHGFALTQEAFDRIAGYTGLRFTYVGVTDHVYGEHVPGVTPNGEITVSWSDQTRNPQLAGGIVGIGGPGGWILASGLRHWTTGGMVLDRDHALRPVHDVAGDPTWGQVIAHELLHVLGLGHARGQEQVMFPSVNWTNHRFGAGDLTGMVHIGATNGCIGD